MKEKKLTIIASATLALVLCISAVVFFADLSQDDLPDCTYKITKEQREMSTYDLLKWFGESSYMQTISYQFDMYWVNSLSFSEPSPYYFPCNDHQAYYELLSRDDLYEAYWKLKKSEKNEYPRALRIFAMQRDLEDILHDGIPKYGEW